MFGIQPEKHKINLLSELGDDDKLNLSFERQFKAKQIYYSTVDETR